MKGKRLLTLLNLRRVFLWRGRRNSVFKQIYLKLTFKTKTNVYIARTSPTNVNYFIKYNNNGIIFEHMFLIRVSSIQSLDHRVVLLPLWVKIQHCIMMLID